MRTQRFAIALVVVSLIAPLPAQKLDVDLQRAIQKETVTGDLKAAIEEYKKIVVRAGSERSVAAKALVHLAECYAKLGDSESRRIYERVVKEYADQKEAVTMARARLGGANSPLIAKGDRAVWTGPLVDMFGRVSSDGRFISFINWNNGSLTVHDVSANHDNVLIPPAPNFSENAGYSTFSKDGKQLVYVWSDKNRRQSLRVADFQGTEIGEPRQFFLASEEVRFIDSFDWSPDRKWIAAAMRLKDGTGQIAVISVADGSSRVLKSLDWNIPERIFFSHDGKSIAYDVPGNASREQRDVNVLAIDGSRDAPAVVHPAKDEVFGWSPDGGQLLFSSDRTGSVGLWAVPFADGRVQGTPELLRSDIGSSMSLGLTASGTLHLYKGTGSRDVRVAAIDGAAGKLLEAPSSFVRGFLPGASNASWSPDGKRLAYAACGGNCLAVRSVDTGMVRKVPHTLLYLRAPQWAPDGDSFLAAGRDARGRDGVYRIDAETGAVSPVAYTTLGAAPRWAHDGKKIFYVNRDSSIVERELASATEREMIRRPGLWREVNVSPDGRYLAVQIQREATNNASLLLVPVAGGEPQELMRLTGTDSWGPMGTTAWTPDSTTVLKIVQRGGSRAELLRIPVTGEPPLKFDIDPELWMRGASGPDLGFSLSPDGKRMAFLMGKSAAEVWAVENILPTQNSKQ